MNIEKALKIAMINKGVNQCELSKLSGVSETTISHSVSGKTKPSIKTVGKLCSALGISYLEFIKLGGYNEKK